MIIKENPVYVDVGKEYRIEVTDVTGVLMLTDDAPSWVHMDGYFVTMVPECPAGYFKVNVCSESERMILDVFVNTPEIEERKTEEMPRMMRARGVTPAVPMNPTSPLKGNYRIAIYNSTGGYIVFGDAESTEMRLRAEPYFYIEENAPSKLMIDVLNYWNSPYDIRDSAFSYWSNGISKAVVEGMQIVYDVYDEITGAPTRRFNGTIASMEVGIDYITIVAYDAMRQLVDFKDPFLLTGQKNSFESTNYYVSVSGGRDYYFSSPIITLLSLEAMDRSGSGDPAIYNDGYFLSDIESRYDGYGLIFWTRTGGYCTRVDTIVTLDGPPAAQGSNWRLNHAIYGVNETTGKPDMNYLIQRLPSVVNIPSGSNYKWTYTTRFLIPHNYSSPRPGERRLFYYAQLEAYSPDPIIINKSCFMGTSGGKSADCTYWAHQRDGPTDAFVDFTTTTRDIYIRNWLVIQDIPRGIPVGSVSVSNNIIFVPCSQLDGCNADAGTSLYASFVTSGVGTMTMISTLVQRAGMTLVGGTPPTKELAWYNTGTVDYLTCVKELIDATANNGAQVCIQASILYPKQINIKTRPQIGITASSCELSVNDATSTGFRKIKSFELAKYIESYISRPTTLTEDSTNTPMALQTDDILWGVDSIENRMGYPSYNIITDNTLRDFNLLSIVNEGQVKKIHRNVIEGKVKLAGYFPTLWAQEGDPVCGGKVFDLDVPQYSPITQAVVRRLTLSNRETILDLDNIREDNRNRVNMSIDRGVDAQTYSLAVLPDTVYIFVRSTSVPASNGTQIYIVGDSTYSTTTIKNVTDFASPVAGKGYVHSTGYFPAPTAGYAVSTPITQVRITVGGTTYSIPTSNPYYAYANQAVVVSIRRPN